MAFDPRKLFNYKVVQDGRTSCDIEIQIYSSETRNWSLCRERFNYFSFDHLNSAIYRNDAFHWLETKNRQLKNYKLIIEDHDHPITTTIQIPHGLHRGRNFLEYFGGYSDNLVLILMEIPQMLHLEGKFFESRGCLLLVCRDDIGSRDVTIYEMRKGCSMWSVRKVVKYNLISKTINEIFDIGSNQMDDDVEFIPPFPVDPNLYKFIPSFESV
ncbi:hypothetical protein Tco_1368274 [Tanacetum coccineum]